MDVGLRHVYVGNLRSPDGGHTWCPNPACEGRATPLVERLGYRILANRLVHGRCPSCGTAVAGVWEQRKEQEP